jgi:hypothetical protein
VVSEAGAIMAKIARNPETKPYHELFRVEPNEAWFDPARSPTSPTSFEIGAVKADVGQAIILLDYRIQPYRFSGVNAFDFVPLDEGRLSGSLGYVVRMNNQNPGNLRYRLDPIPSTLRTQSSQMSRGPIVPIRQQTAADFIIAAATQYASAAGYGSSVMPQTPRRYGAPDAPFTEYVYEDVIFTMTGVVYRQIESPVAFIQGEVMGYKCPAMLLKQIERDLSESLR